MWINLTIKEAITAQLKSDLILSEYSMHTSNLYKDWQVAKGWHYYDRIDLVALSKYIKRIYLNVTHWNTC